MLIRPDDLEAREETLDLLSQPGALGEIRHAEVDIDAGLGLSAADVRAKYVEEVVDRMDRFELRLAPSAERALQRLPESVAAAIAAFITGALLEEPFR